MSRPRKPFGSSQPGRLPSTMMKVLAAEMSDPTRLRRGKQYAKDGSVLDIVIEPGIVTCEVQGSRSTPYIASLEVSQGDGMPLRRDVHATCTCPDDDNWDDHACKHVLATMFTFADELLMEPELLDLWRGNEHHVADRDDPDREDGHEHDDPEPTPPRRKRHLELVRDGIERSQSERAGRTDESERESKPAAPEHVEDPIASLLAIPDGETLPEIPHLEREDPQLPRRPELAGVLRDALANLRIDWD